MLKKENRECSSLTASNHVSNSKNGYYLLTTQPLAELVYQTCLKLPRRFGFVLLGCEGSRLLDGELGRQDPARRPAPPQLPPRRLPTVLLHFAPEIYIVIHSMALYLMSRKTFGEVSCSRVWPRLRPRARQTQLFQTPTDPRVTSSSISTWVSEYPSVISSLQNVSQ